VAAWLFEEFMAAIYCPYCNIANYDNATRCHACAGKLKPLRTDERVSGSQRLMMDEFGYLDVERRKHAWTAARALISAAIMSMIRAALIPYLIQKSPPGTFGQIDPSMVQMTGFFMVIVFAAAAFWAMENPLLAVAAAMLFYAAISVPDLLQGSGLLGRGVISKSVMMMVLVRGLVAGAQHHMLKRGEAV